MKRRHFREKRDGFLARASIVAEGMCSGEFPPVINGSPPRKDSGEVVASAARARHRIWDTGFLVNPSLNVIGHRLCFFGREAMIRAEVLNNVPSFGRSEFDVVQKNHALQRSFPTFRSRPFPGNALHVTPAVDGVAASAFRFHQWIRDWNAFLGFLLGCWPHRWLIAG